MMRLFSTKRVDRVLLLAVLALVAIGIVMITSIGVPKSIDLSAPEGLHFADCSNEAVDCYFILKRHLIRVGLGLLGMLFMWKIPTTWLRQFAPMIYALGAGLLVLVLFTGQNNGTFAQSWLQLPGLDSLQPSEIAKLGLILYLSFFLSEKLSPAQVGDFKEGFMKFATITGIVVGLIALQPDVGSAMIVSGIAVVVYLLAGANLKHFAMILGVVGFLGLIAFSTQDHIQKRVEFFLTPIEECDGSEKCWQTRQANIAIGVGGFWGEGLTQGVQKWYWLPQAVDDFIFAATALELGFLRMTFVVLLYATIAYRGYLIALRAPNKFAMLTAGGITTWITMQSFVNIMVNTALFPITGITLPFFSYGGSSMVMTLTAVGILLNISQTVSSDANLFDRRRNGGARYTQPRTSGRYARL